MNKKGQALVEFILILPLFLVLIMSFIELGNVLVMKHHLENDLIYIAELYRNNDINTINEYTNKNSITYIKEIQDEYITLKIKKNVEISTPFINLIIPKDLSIETKMVIINE